MSTAALFIALVLAGQVRSANERYPVAGNNSPGGNSAPAANPAGGSSSESGLIPKIEPPPAGDPARTSAPSDNAGAVSSPFARQLSAPVTGDQPLGRPNGATASPPPTSDGQSLYRSSASQSGATAPSTVPATGIKPSAMMKQMLSPPPGSQLSGSSVSLLDVVVGARSRQEQAQRVEAYWDLCSSVADYYLGLREQGELAKLRSLMPRAGATLQQAESEFVVRLGTSRQAAVASQRRLASMMGRGNTSLPLPADLPHCGSYQSHYEQIFAGRPSVEAQELAVLLPLRYAELKDAANAVKRAQEWIGAVAQNESGDGTDTLRALELLALRRRAFVQIARDYNRRIARYTELSTPGEIGAERLVGMLIKVDVPPTATRPSSPSGATGRQSRNSAVLPRTFADEGWEPAGQSVSRATTLDESVEPASAEVKPNPRREERSLLVSPR
ncbi:MAG: hypothetical protein L0228_20230 [Planctomycetes bacterium]|nr:hypothetical protein [Planctomycetota bacterium]